MRTNASDGQRTFTEVARRAQIAQCTAEALAELGYADASMAEIAKRAGVAKSVVSYHFSDKEELLREVLRTALATFAGFMEPRMAAATSAADKLHAYLAGTARYIVEHQDLHLAVLEIAFNATSADGRPLVATMPLQAPEPSVEEILRQGQRDGEFRDFDVMVVAGVVRSAVTHSMVMRQRQDPGADMAAYAEELVRLFDLGVRR
ncbi:MAG: TetR/AcrR family transcriptional regulator [Streptosporangiaceae bacterium]|jgi:AcrR family transcriptional regulator